MSMYPNSIARCQHIKVNGTQCGSPALKSRRQCFFHNRWHESRIDFNKAGSLHFIDSFALPVLEDANSVQVAIMQVLRLIIAKHLDAKTAGLLLYGLQTASINLKHTCFEAYDKTNTVIEPRFVGETPLGEHPWDPRQYEARETEEVEDENQEVEEEVNEEKDGGEPVPAASQQATAGHAPLNHQDPDLLERTRNEIRSLLAGEQHLLLELAQVRKSP